MQSNSVNRGRRESDHIFDLSLVVPMWNEEESVDIFFERVVPIVESITESYEIICIDDGSSDSTLALLTKHRVRNPQIKVLSLSRNFGKDVALSAGLDFSRGQAVVPMDVDLQDPPELIPQMYRRKQEGYDVVLAVRKSRDSDNWFKRKTARIFYRVHNSVAEITIPNDAGDFRMLDQKVIEVLRHLPERTRFMKGLFAWVGFTTSTLEYERQPRAAGKTKWQFWKLWNFALDGITASSTLPLRIWTYFGVLISVFAFLFASYLLIETLLHGNEQPGYASTMIAILFLGGINIMATGILGEYLGRVYVEVRNRPLYIVRETHGFDSSVGEENWTNKFTKDSTPSKANTGGSARAAKSSPTSLAS